MIINIKQESFDSKEKYLQLIEFIESMGYDTFDIGCYDKDNKLSEATLLDISKVKQIVRTDDSPEFES